MRPKLRHIAAAFAGAAFAVSALSPLPAAALPPNVDPLLTCPEVGDGYYATYNARTGKCGRATKLGPGGCTTDKDGNCLKGTKQGGCIHPDDPHGDPVSVKTGGGCPRVFCKGIGKRWRDETVGATRPDTSRTASRS